MLQISVEDLKDGQKKLSITISQEEAKPFLEDAAKTVSKDVKIKGFRPGHAPYEQVVKQVGEMAVLETSLDPLVRHFYKLAVLENELEVVGPPHVDVTQLAPDNDITFEATVNIMPVITKLADWKSLSVKAQPIQVSDKEIDAAIKDLQRMRTNEVRAKKDETLGETDKAVIDLDMTQNKVAVEGGSSKGAVVYMDQESYLPGLKKEILGMKEGETREFQLTFPKEHFQKMLAGKNVDVKATLKELFHLETPNADDAFAKTLGLESLKELKEKLNENIGHEKEMEESQRQERALLEAVVEKCTFSEIPKALIQNEQQKMVQELKQNVARQGLDFETYLQSLGKTADELANDMEAQAILRVQIAVLLTRISKEEGITIADADLDAELDKLAEMHPDNKEAKERIFSPDFREYQTRVMENREVINRLREAMIS